MADITFPRVASVIRATGEVSAIAQRQAPPDLTAYRGRAEDDHPFLFEAVSPAVRVGMIRAADGTYSWPVGHPNEPYESRKKRLDAERALAAGRAA